MDLNKYLIQRQTKIKSRIKNIKDLQVFDFNYVPTHPIERPEMDKITRAILKYEWSHIPTNIFAFGSRGCCRDW